MNAAPAILAAAAASLAGTLSAAVYTGQADPSPAFPYVVLVQPQEAESVFEADKIRATLPTDVVVTCRVWGGFADCEQTAAATLTLLLAPGALSPAGHRVVDARLAQNVPVPGPPPDAPQATTPTGATLYGRQVAVRFTVHPTA